MSAAGRVGGPPQHPWGWALGPCCLKEGAKLLHFIISWHISQEQGTGPLSLKMLTQAACLGVLTHLIIPLRAIDCEFCLDHIWRSQVFTVLSSLRLPLFLKALSNPGCGACQLFPQLDCIANLTGAGKHIGEHLSPHHWQCCRCRGKSFARLVNAEAGQPMEGFMSSDSSEAKAALQCA